MRLHYGRVTLLSIHEKPFETSAPAADLVQVIFRVQNTIIYIYTYYIYIYMVDL